MKCQRVTEMMTGNITSLGSKATHNVTFVTVVNQMKMDKGKAPVLEDKIKEECMVKLGLWSEKRLLQRQRRREGLKSRTWWIGGGEGWT